MTKPCNLGARAILFCLTSVLFFSLFALSGCKGKKNTNVGFTAQPPDVSAVIMRPRPVENKIFSTGTILANEEVEIRSEVSGRIRSLNFSEGSHVSRGDLLVKIVDDDLQAELKKLILQEDLAKTDVFRKSKLLEMDAISSEEYELAANQLGIIQANIDAVRYRISQTEIRAPFTGHIGLRYVSPGEFINTSTTIASLQEVDPVKIEFTIPEKYIPQMKENAYITFQVEGHDEVFRGQVYAIEPKIDATTRSLTARAKCPNPGNVLYPGAFARVQIVLEEITDALVVPSEAIIPDIRGEKVFMCEDGKAVYKYIETGIRMEREVQVTSGLEAGDTVIITGLLQLREGMKVNIRPVAENDPAE